MKKINNYLSILIFLLLSTSNSFANKIAYIDLDVVFKNSNEGKKIQIQLDSKKSEQLDIIKGEEIKIKQIEDEIRNKQNIISQEELKIEVAELKKRVKEFNLYKNQIKKKYNENKNEQIMNFFNKIDPFLRAYMKENSIDILLNNKNIIIGKDSLDITEKMINIINNSLKE